MFQDGPLNGDEEIDPTTLDVVTVQPDTDPVPLLPSYTEAGQKFYMTIQFFWSYDGMTLFFSQTL